jgi:hypothetical protein
MIFHTSPAAGHDLEEPEMITTASGMFGEL